MALRIQHERFESDLNLDLEEYKSLYQLTTERISMAKGDAIIMHPGPVNMDIEISETAYQSENCVIRNASNGTEKIERYFKSLEGGVRALLLESGFSDYMYFDAAHVFAHHYNSLPTAANRISASEAP